ncbi:MAG: hypothetical protein NT018_01525 [Armatimonadetes bacterium]|nr:hypothetical protein [Armatimonadota bacterium]
MIDCLFLTQIERRLDIPAAVKEQVLRELASHLAEIREELVEAGMNPVLAEFEAENRLGNPSDIAARLNATHSTASWKSALLCAVPYIGLALLSVIPSSLSAAFMIILGMIFTVASIREIVLNRRPVWLAPWLAGVLTSCLLVLDINVPAIMKNDLITANISALIFSTLIAVFALIAAWHVGRWKLGTSIFCLMYFAAALVAAYQLHHSTLGTAFSVSILVLTLSIVALIVYLSRCIFEVHPYGNAVQASTFLLVLFTVAGSAEVSHFAVSQLLCACAIIWLARAQSRQHKCSAIYATLFIYSLASPVAKAGLESDSPAILATGAALSALVSAALIYFVVSIPMHMELLSRPNRPSIVR